jgi:cyclomaltodextrinase
LRFHQEVIALRTAHPALRVGSSVPLHADQDVYAFARRLDGCELVVAVNVAETPREVDLVPASRLEQSSPAQVLFATGGDVTLTSGPTGLSLTLPARGGAVVDTAPRARPTR